MMIMMRQLQLSSALIKRSFGCLKQNNNKNFIQFNNKRTIQTTTILQYKNPEDWLPPYVDIPNSYSFGRSITIPLHKTLGQLLDERAQLEHKGPLIISHHEGFQKTFEQFYNDVNRVAKAMHEHIGLKHGDVIGLWSSNTYDWIVVQYAAGKLGVILCTLNPFYQTLELNFGIRKSRMKALFMPGKNSRQETINKFTQILVNVLNLKEDDKNQEKDLKFHLESVVCLDGEILQPEEIPSEKPVKMFHMDKLKETSGQLDKTITDLVLPDDPMMIMFTSGTTGKPKGACQSHFGFINNMHCVLVKSHITDDTVLCNPLPYFHAFAAIFGNLLPLLSDSKIVIPCLKYNVRQLAEAINLYNATHMYATPTLAIDLLNYVRNNNIDLPSLGFVMAGGASVPVEIANQYLDYIPSCKNFRIGYGATECGPGVTINTAKNTYEERTSTVGQPLDYVEVKIVNPITKKVVPLGETGELHTRGPHVMLGYWDEPEKTASVIDKAGWYNSEDLAVMDERGFVKIIGRTKEMIIVGGENVYPREIEELLHTHPAVATAHVIGVPDERKGEEVCAWVQLHQGSTATEEELKQFCKHNITYFKVPRYIMFVDQFPLTPTGKAKKFVMQEMTIQKLNLKAAPKQMKQ